MAGLILMRDMWEKVAVWFGVKVDMWENTQLDNDDVHVVPVADTIDHVKTDDCACEPTVEPVKRKDGSIGWVYTHNAQDGRK